MQHKEQYKPHGRASLDNNKLTHRINNDSLQKVIEEITKQ